jgi:hypothetical protein
MLSPSFAIIFLVVCVFVFFGLVVFVGAPYVPSHKKDVKRAFEYFGLGSADTLVDIGSGDGIILRTASSYGAKAVGYEINPILVGISRLLSRRDERVTVLLQNAWLANLPDSTTMVYVFGVNRDEGKVINLLQREANRLNVPLKLLCYGSPFKRMVAVDTFEAYHLYIFQPLQPKNA